MLIPKITAIKSQRMVYWRYWMGNH